MHARLVQLSPRIVAVLGIGAFRTGFGRPRSVLGPQDEELGASRLWVLPNPSGLNTHYQLEALVERFSETPGRGCRMVHPRSRRYRFQYRPRTENMPRVGLPNIAAFPYRM